MDTLKGLVNQISTLIGTNLNGFLAGIAVALYFLWSKPPTPQNGRQLGMPPQPGAPSGEGAGAGDGKPEEGDLDEVKIERSNRTFHHSPIRSPAWRPVCVSSLLACHCLTLIIALYWVSRIEREESPAMLCTVCLPCHMGSHLSS